MGNVYPNINLDFRGMEVSHVQVFQRSQAFSKMATINKHQKITGIGKDVEKLELLCTAGGNI